MEPLSMKMLSTLFYHRAGTERIGKKTRAAEIQIHRQSHTEETQSSVTCIHEFDFTIFILKL